MKDDLVAELKRQRDELEAESVEAARILAGALGVPSDPPPPIREMAKKASQVIEAIEPMGEPVIYLKLSGSFSPNVDFETPLPDGSKSVAEAASKGWQLLGPPMRLNCNYYWYLSNRDINLEPRLEQLEADFEDHKLMGF